MSIIPKTILRELSPSEKVLDYEARSCSLMDSRSFLISSEINLFENIDLIKKAIHEWKKIHKLLRACIHIDPHNQLIRHFALASDDIVNNCNNIKFLKFDSPSHCKDYWKILYENDVFKPFNHEQGLLWRLYFLKEDEKSYRIIFTVHHAILDGRAHFCLIHQLTQMIEWIYLSKNIKLSEYELFLPIDRLLLNDELKNTDEDVQDAAIIENYKVPDYFKPKSENFENLLMKDANINTHDNQVYMSIDSLLIENKKISFTKFMSFVVETEKYLKILKKCKENGLKFTGYISTLIKTALTEAPDHFSDEHHRTVQKKFKYYVAASSRDSLKLNNYIMGNYATILYFESKIIDDRNYENFWDLAKKESDEIHFKIDTNDSASSLKEDEKFLKEIEKGFCFDEYEKDFLLSNLGDMTKYCITEANLFKIKEHYLLMSNRKYSIYNVFVNGIATLNSRLFWTISYPSYLVKPEVVDFVIKKINLIIGQTLN